MGYFANNLDNQKILYAKEAFRKCLEDFPNTIPHGLLNHEVERIRSYLLRALFQYDRFTLTPEDVYKLLEDAQ